VNDLRIQYRGKATTVSTKYISLLKDLFRDRRSQIDVLVLQLQREPTHDLALAELVNLIDQTGGLDLCRTCGALPGKSTKRFCNTCGVPQ